MPRSRTLVITASAAIALLIVAPTGWSTLTGSGLVSDIVQLSVSTGTLPALDPTFTGSSASGNPALTTSAFTMTNGGSNLDTFLRYSWTALPYYGASSAQTSITI